jgi:hypothetical protein
MYQHDNTGSGDLSLCPEVETVNTGRICAKLVSFVAPTQEKETPEFVRIRQSAHRKALRALADEIWALNTKRSIQQARVNTLHESIVAAPDLMDLRLAIAHERSVLWALSQAIDDKRAIMLAIGRRISA